MTLYNLQFFKLYCHFVHPDTTELSQPSLSPCRQAKMAPVVGHWSTPPRVDKSRARTIQNRGVRGYKKR